MRFGERLRNLRAKHSISGYKLGLLTDRPRQFVSNIENGHRPPPDEFLKKLATIDILAITYDELKAWALEDKYTNLQLQLARKNYAENIDVNIIRVPLISPATLNFINDLRIIDPKCIEDWLFTRQKVSADAIAVKIADDGMAFRICLNDIVVLEPVSREEELDNKTMYVFKQIDKGFIARILYKVENQYYLLPVNYKKYYAEKFDSKKDIVVGKAVEIIKLDNFTPSDNEIKELEKKLLKPSPKS